MTRFQCAVACLCVASLALPAAGQRSAAASSQHLPTFVTQLGATHFPGGEAALEDEATAIVALPSGAVIVLGETYGSLGEPHAGPSDGTDVFLARFGPAGDPEWIRQIGATTAARIPALHGDPAGPGGDASSSERAAGLAVASDGSIYVAGTTYGSLGETNGGLYSDVFLAKFDEHGSLQWLRQLGAETAATFASPKGGSIDTSDYERAGSIVVDPSGDVYLAGETGGSLADINWDASDVFLARFSDSGRLRWVRQMGWMSSARVGFDTQGFDFAPKLALHPSGSIVLVCSSEFWDFGVPVGIDILNSTTMLTFDAQGVPLASRSLLTDEEGAGDLAIDPRSGAIYLAGGTTNELSEPNGGHDAFVARFDLDLELVWARQIGVTTANDLGLIEIKRVESVVGCCIDSAGDIVVAGSTTGSLNEPNAGPHRNDVFTAKFRSTDGEVLRVSQIGATTSALHGLGAKMQDWVQGVCLAPDDTIAVAGYTTGNLGGPQGGARDVFVMRLAPDGSL